MEVMTDVLVGWVQMSRYPSCFVSKAVARARSATGRLTKIVGHHELRLRRPEDEGGTGFRQRSDLFVGRFRNTQSSPIGARFAGVDPPPCPWNWPWLSSERLRWVASIGSRAEYFRSNSGSRRQAKAQFGRIRSRSRTRRPARCSAGRKVRPANICALGISAQLARFRKCRRRVPLAPRSPRHTSPASVALARLAEKPE